MDCTAIDKMDLGRESPRPFGGLLRLMVGVSQLMRPSLPRLELDILPDHLKRDIGFMDGRDPRYEDDRSR